MKYVAYTAVVILLATFLWPLAAAAAKKTVAKYQEIWSGSTKIDTEKKDE